MKKFSSHPRICERLKAGDEGVLAQYLNRLRSLSAKSSFPLAKVQACLDLAIVYSDFQAPFQFVKRLAIEAKKESSFPFVERILLNRTLRFSKCPEEFIEFAPILLLPTLDGKDAAEFALSLAIMEAASGGFACLDVAYTMLGSKSSTWTQVRALKLYLSLLPYIRVEDINRMFEALEITDFQWIQSLLFDIFLTVSKIHDSHHLECLCTNLVGFLEHQNPEVQAQAEATIRHLRENFVVFSNEVDFSEGETIFSGSLLTPDEIKMFDFDRG